MRKNKKISNMKKTSIGGQALMEGIMMRGPAVTAMAVRNTQGEIIVEKEPTSVVNAPGFFKLPIIRGVYSFIYSMITGSKYLMRSAEISGLEEIEADIEREKKAKKAEKKAAKAAKRQKNAPAADADKPTEVLSSRNSETEIPEIGDTEAKTDDIELDGISENSAGTEKSGKKEKSSPFVSVVMVLGVILGIAIAIGLFVVLPSFIYDFIKRIPAIANTQSSVLKSLYKSLFEGIVRLILIVGYMAAISLMKDIRRTFMYHGAEHKTIFCYEAGIELTVDNVRKQRKYHPRCGTSFLVLMILVSIFVSFFIDPVFALITGQGEMPTILRVLIKLLFLPVVMGLGYELIKLAGKHDNVFTRIISAPGMWLQHITVFEPTDDMIECAIAAMKEVIPDDNSDILE